jgi:RNA polymerase sigma-70 factor (ECF subfamily)
LYGKYKDKVFSTALRITRNRDEASDVVQETFVTVLRKIRGFRFRSLFSSWLYRVAVNVSIDRRRRLREGPMGLPQAGRSHEAADPDDVEFESRDAGPAATFDERERERRVREEIGSLSLKLRTVLVLRYIEGLSYQEIGQVLRCSTGTVKSRLNRAHRAMVERLGERFRAP